MLAAASENSISRSTAKAATVAFSAVVRPPNTPATFALVASTFLKNDQPN